jgi:peptidyl-prolyl cis-trans isomerase B (cyclophilin B)
MRLLAQRALVSLVALVALTSAVGCAPAQPAADGGQPAPQPPAPEQAAGLHTGTYKAKGSETVLVKTDKGSFTINLYPKDAPNTVSSFLELTSSGFYNGIKVHRVEPNFVVQLGDPQTRKLSGKDVAAIVARQQQPQAGDPQLGTGDPGWKLKAEFNGRKHVDGAVAMARAQDPDSAGSQFYITLGAQPFLDGQYTVFGQVVKGMDVVRKLQPGDAIVSMTIQGE